MTRIKIGNHKKKGARTPLLANPRYLWIALACGVVIAGVLLLDLYVSTIPVAKFITFHLILELSSIVVSFAVFATGWYGYRNSGNLRDLVIGITFFTTGAVDLIHAVSYKGMPDLLGVNTPGKAAAYWLLARIVVGIGLLSASFINPQARARRLHAVALLSTSIVLIVASTTLFTLYGDTVGTALYSRIGSPPTALKSAIELLAIGLYIGTFALASPERGWENSVVVDLRSAMVVAIFAEIAFMLYLTPFGWVNALGHVYKTVAYYMILNALFASAIRKPYEQLAQARDELKSLYEDAYAHREEMERSFANIGSALSSSLKLDEALDLIANLIVEMRHVNCSVVVSLDRTGTKAEIAVQKGRCHKEEQPIKATLKIGRQAIEKGESVIIDKLSETGMIDCDFTKETCLRSMACAPMILEGRPLGLVAVFSYKESAFDRGDAKLLEGFASHAAVAIGNALSYERESRIANVLQKSILASPSLKTDRFEIAQVYQPASDEALIGGDFYDVFELNENKVGIVIGDVSGKGLTAAVHTAMVRYTLRAYAEEGHSPGTIMQLLNRLIGKYMGNDAFVTMFLGLLDAETGSLLYSSAGHEPPIYMCDSTGLTLPPTGPALGTGIDQVYEEGTIKMEKSCTLLLYTDGISEARKGDEFLGAEGITEIMQTCKEATIGEVVQCIHKAAIEFAGGDLRDDAAILSVRALR
jgi:hypothetical protein